MPATPLAPPELVEALKEDWRAGATPDLRAALRDHPTLLRHRSLVLDLAFEAYALQEEAGAAPDPQAFCRSLPAYRSDVRGMLLDYRALADHPEILEEVRWPKPGDTFEGFQVVRELGHGAFARAYLATDPDTGGRRVVLKLSATTSAEAQTQGQVRHAHVAEVLWARRAGGVSAIAMPYCGAATLRDVVAAAFELATEPPTARTVLEAIDTAGVGLPPPNDPAPPALLRPRGSYADAIARIAAPLAGALAYLHGQGVTHGDLKPSNIVLAPGGHPYLIDFNLSGRDGEANRYGGTLPYMAPERVQRLVDMGVATATGAASDVYSLGAVLYEALSGQVPFVPAEGDDLKAIATDLHRRQVAGSPRLSAAGVPRALARLVERCLSVDPAGRPTAVEVERRLRRFVGRRGRRVRTATIGIVAILLLSAAAWTVSQAGEGTGSKSETGTGVSGGQVAKFPEEHGAAGWTLLANGKYDRAFDRFLTAFQEKNDGRTLAMMAYCKSRAGKHREAVGYYWQAMDEFNYDPDWVRNNRAHGMIRNAVNRPVELGPALTELEDLLAGNRAVRPAYYNRAYAQFFQSLDRKSWTLTDPTLLARINADLEPFLSETPAAPDLYFIAAQVLAASAAGNKAVLDRAMNHLRTAVAHGYSPRMLEHDPVFSKWLGHRADFKAVCSSPVGRPPTAAVNLGIADPTGP